MLFRSPDVSVIMKGTTTTSLNSTGKYSCNCLPIGSTGTIRLQKNNEVNKSNGITGLDVALVQSHILQKSLLNSPYKLIAADVNGDGKITGLDLVYMKRMIFGIDTTFPNYYTKENRLWVFVDSAYKIPVVTNPFPFKDSIVFSKITANKINQSFIGIKLGDVNWDWNPGLAKMASPVYVKPKEIIEEQ